MKVKVCARCGSNPREGELFICTTCREDPQTANELLEATNAAHGHNGASASTARTFLVLKMNWHGWR